MNLAEKLADNEFEIGLWEKPIPSSKSDSPIGMRISVEELFEEAYRQKRIQDWINSIGTESNTNHKQYQNKANDEVSQSLSENAPK